MSTPPTDAYDLILKAIEDHDFRPGDRLVEIDLAEKFGVSRTPIREALKQLEAQDVVTRDGRSLIVASLDHDQLGELYAVRGELEGLAAALAAQHAAAEEIAVLRDMLSEDRALIKDPVALSRANRRFHRQIHMASHNRYLVRLLATVQQAMALMASTSIAVEGRGPETIDEHALIVSAIENREAALADETMRAHISRAFETRLRHDLEGIE